MVEAYEIFELALPHDSPFVDFLLRCPDIELKAFSEGEYLIRQGDDDADTFVVIRGAYAVESIAAGQEGAKPQILATVESDERDPSFVGEMAYLGGVFRTASVRSVGRTYTFCLRPRHLDILIDNYPFFTRVLCRQFTERLREANLHLLEYHKRLAIRTEMCFLEKGEVLYEKGKVPTSAYRLLQGMLICDATEEDPNRRRPDLLKEFVEPLPFFLGNPSPRTVRTDSRAHLVRIDLESREALIRNHPELVLELLKKPSRSQ